jgi:hypothetical protein
MITKDARRTRETKSGIYMAKAAFDKKRALLTGKVDLNCKKQTSKVLHLE